MKHKSPGKLRKELIDLAKLCAKIRDGYVCQKSGEVLKGSNAHGSHVIPVSHGGSLPFDPENIITLSYHWHINWWHKNPMEASEWFKTKFPERWEYIQSHMNDEVHYKWFDYEEKIAEMKLKIKELEENKNG